MSEPSILIKMTFGGVCGNRNRDTITFGFHTDSTFADQFYGLKYRSTLPGGPSRRPTSRQKLLILGFIVRFSLSFSLGLPFHVLPRPPYEPRHTPSVM